MSRNAMPAPNHDDPKRRETQSRGFRANQLADVVENVIEKTNDLNYKR